MADMLVEISSLNHRGEGVGRIVSGEDKGLVVFVSGTVPGDLVKARILERKKNYIRGRVSEILKEGSGRVGAPCKVAARCGGCTWQHIDYPTQLAWKKRLVQESLARIARLEVPVDNPLPSPDILGYRNKVEVPVVSRGGKTVAGFFEPYSHDVVPSEDCLLEHPLARELVQEMLSVVRHRRYAAYDERTGRGQIRHLVARVAPGTGERMAVFVSPLSRIPGESELARDLLNAVPGLECVALNINPERTNVIMGDRDKIIAGRGYIEDVFGSPEIGFFRFRISPRSFYQVNSRQAAELYRIALGELEGLSGLAYDIYSGIGTITLFAAKKFELVIGIEEVDDAVEDAKKNGRKNGVDNAFFVCGRAERVIHQALARWGKPSAIILDPPRGGAEQQVLEAIVRADPERVVYVSCNPSTLARDLIYLTENGFAVNKVIPVDMFPMTPHVECVAVLRRE